MLIDGIHVPLTAPFYRDGRSYLRKLEHNVARYSLTPAAGLVALASESTALTDAESNESLLAVSEFAAKGKVLLAAIERESIHSALLLAEQAEAASFDALLLRTPRFIPSEDVATALLFIRSVADSTTLPILLHSQLRSPFSIEAIGELASHPNIIGIYDDMLTPERYKQIAAVTASIKRAVTVTTIFAPVTRRMLKVEAQSGGGTFVSADALAGGVAVAIAPSKPTIKTRTKTVGFQIMAAGTASGMVTLLQEGVAGAMPELAACTPQGVYEAFAAFKDGNPELAAEKQQRLTEADALMAKLGISGIKYGCDWNGYYGGMPRLPRLPLSASERAEVERVLASLRN